MPDPKCWVNRAMTSSIWSLNYFDWQYLIWHDSAHILTRVMFLASRCSRLHVESSSMKWLSEKSGHLKVNLIWMKKIDTFIGKNWVQTRSLWIQWYLRIYTREMLILLTQTRGFRNERYQNVPYDAHFENKMFSRQIWSMK